MTDLAMIRIFIPLSDISLEESNELYQNLVPFNPAYLDGLHRRDEGQKPHNWVDDGNHAQACARLFASASSPLKLIGRDGEI